MVTHAMKQKPGRKDSNPMSKVRIHVYLTKAQVTELKLQAETLDISVSEVLRRILSVQESENKFSQNPNPEEESYEHRD